MKAWDYEAVVYEGDVYCAHADCLPDGVDHETEAVHPIFASTEWDAPGATCTHCGWVHDYMNLLEVDHG